MDRFINGTRRYDDGREGMSAFSMRGDKSARMSAPEATEMVGNESILFEARLSRRQGDRIDFWDGNLYNNGAYYLSPRE